jgi:hypothetical protein
MQFFFGKVLLNSASENSAGQISKIERIETAKRCELGPISFVLPLRGLSAKPPCTELDLCFELRKR